MKNLSLFDFSHDSLVNDGEDSSAGCSTSSTSCDNEDIRRNKSLKQFIARHNSERIVGRGHLMREMAAKDVTFMDYTTHQELRQSSNTSMGNSVSRFLAAVGPLISNRESHPDEPYFDCKEPDLTQFDDAAEEDCTSPELCDRNSSKSPPREPDSTNPFFGMPLAAYDCASKLTNGLEDSSPKSTLDDKVAEDSIACQSSDSVSYVAKSSSTDDDDGYWQCLSTASSAEDVTKACRSSDAADVGQCVQSAAKRSPSVDGDGYWQYPSRTTSAEDVTKACQSSDAADVGRSVMSAAKGSPTVAIDGYCQCPSKSCEVHFGSNQLNYPASSNDFIQVSFDDSTVPDTTAHHSDKPAILSELQPAPTVPEPLKLTPQLSTQTPLPHVTPPSDLSPETIDRLLEVLLTFDYPPDREKQALYQIMDLVFACKKKVINYSNLKEQLTAMYSQSFPHLLEGFVRITKSLETSQAVDLTGGHVAPPPKPRRKCRNLVVLLNMNKFDKQPDS